MDIYKFLPDIERVAWAREKAKTDPEYKTYLIESEKYLYNLLKEEWFTKKQIHTYTDIYYSDLS